MYVVVHWTESLLSVAFTENSDFAARVLVPHSGLGNLSLFFRCTVRSVVRHLSGEPRFDGTCCSLLLAAACCLLFLPVSLSRAPVLLRALYLSSSGGSPAPPCTSSGASVIQSGGPIEGLEACSSRPAAQTKRSIFTCNPVAGRRWLSVWETRPRLLGGQGRL